MRLPLRNKLLYASSNFGSEALTRSRSLWLIYYYAPPADSGLKQILPSLVVGILLAVGGLASSLNHLVIGYLSDRTSSRLGRRIPYVLAGAPLAAIFFVLVFSPPPDSSTATSAIYLFFTVELAFLFGAVAGGPYEALQPEIATTSNERVSVQAMKVYFGIAGAAVGLVGSDLLVQQVGFRTMALVMGALALGFRLLGLAGVSRIPADITLREALRATVSNGPFRALLPSVVMFALAFELLQGVIPFYAHDVVPEGSWLTSTMLLASAIISAVACVPGFVWLARKTSKRQAYRSSMLAAAIGFPLLAVAGLLPGVPIEFQILAATVLIGAPIGAHYLFPLPLTADVIDDDSSKTNQRREATFLGAATFIEQTAGSLAPLVLVVILLLGNTRADSLGVRLVGPVAGLIVFGGYLLFRRYDTPDDVLGRVEPEPAAASISPPRAAPSVLAHPA
jgi:GPH family glycoside/pentoside/hexuronide:cation symporter